MPTGASPQKLWWTAARATQRPAALVATLPECLPEEHAVWLMEHGIAPLCGLDETLDACDAAAFLAGPASSPVGAKQLPGQVRLLDEWESKQVLARYGVPIPSGVRACSSADARAQKYPAVAKALGIAHKTEQHAVRLDLPDAESVRRAAAELEHLGSGLLIEEMVQDSVAELIVGVARDPALGPYLLMGSGGVLAELLADRVVLMLRASQAEIADAVASLKVASLIAGYRGRPAGDMHAVIAAIEAIQRAAIDNLDRLVELDVNPLIITASGAVAADALIRFVEPLQ